MSPSTPKNVTNPNSVMKWEDFAGLEHACWACPTKANSPRALNSCYGIHSMPCASYHPTMHAIGGGHRCGACTNAEQMHENRHREIAELVAEYRSIEDSDLDSQQSPLAERSPNLHNRPAHLRPIAPLRANVLDAMNDVEAEDGENNNENDTASFTSSELSSAGRIDEPPPKLTKREQRVEKKAKKAERSQKKAMKNQCRRLVTVTAADIEKVAQVLHGKPEAESNSSHPLATDKTIEDVIARNLSFVKHIQNHKQYLYKSVADGRKENKERKRLKQREQKGEYEDSETEEIINAVLVKLGIDAPLIWSVTPATANAASTAPAPNTRRKRASLSAASTNPSSNSVSKSKKEILQKLHDAIKNDLEKHENEVRGTCTRAGAFWRYVGKAVFDRMTDFARETDISTGENREKKVKWQAAATLKAQQEQEENHDAVEAVE